MYRFIRTSTIKTASLLPSAMGFGIELTGWLNKKYDINLHLGTEVFGGLNMHWHMDMTSLSAIEEFQTKLTNDKEYWSHIERGSEYWVEGSLHDTIVKIID